ncbi:hypothetical protein [Shewanella putrefaciens]|uniref:hypothetical protein n=1 Tax=Shewanella putrefaciens TaxID=24 RepID=UPI002858CEDB|nr:hypothetical protein [Shewanella putrefaciens]MDR6964047.1 hypothetical protein [Shewanella putrefaciens]
MENVATFWKWINNNGSGLGVVLVLIPLAWAVFTYLSVKRQELKEQRFQAYHKLIQSLVERERIEIPMSLDRQIAIIFELRNFKEYFPVTLRIFKGLKESWAEYGPDKKRERLHEELNLAINYIEKKL